MNALICLIFAVSSFAGEVPSEAQICKTKIELAARKVHIVGAQPIGCRVVDPACASLQTSSKAIGGTQKEVLERCKIAGVNHCPAYEEHIKAGMAGEASWVKVMHNCSPSIDSIPPGFFPCICELEKTPIKNGVSKDASGFMPPQPTGGHTDEKLN